MYIGIMFILFDLYIFYTTYIWLLSDSFLFVMLSFRFYIGYIRFGSFLFPVALERLSMLTEILTVFKSVTRSCHMNKINL